MKHLDIRIDGRVQGVSFRFAARKKAQSLGVKGYVKNQPDGTVFIEAEGEEKQLNDFLKWCYKGSPLANVMDVKIQESKPKHFSTFDINI